VSGEKSTFSLRVRLEAPVEKLVNVRAYEGGKRICSVSLNEVGSSGDYRNGFCYFEADGMKRGTPYTILASTFKPGQMGPFLLHIETSCAKHKIEAIPREGKGMSRIKLSGRWSVADGSAAGCSNHGRYDSNPRYKLTVHTPTALFARVRVIDPPNFKYPSLNVSIFSMESENQHCRVSKAHATSENGVYANSPSGAATPRSVEFSPGEYLVVPSTFHPNDESGFELFIYSDRKVDCARIR